jgi:hypothetical protein
VPPRRLAGVDSARDVASATRLLVGLPVFLRRRLVGEEAHAVIRRRLERRSATFLELVRRAIFARPGSPYHRLLRLAGCELGDLAHLVQQDGLEGALRALFRAGVYLRTDEAKGRQPVERGGQRFRIRPTELQNPLLATLFRMHTGGSSGAPVSEQERADGRPRVVLIVHPGVGTVDPAAVTEYLLERLGRGSGAERIMALTLRQSGILEVERRVPPDDHRRQALAGPQSHGPAAVLTDRRRAAGAIHQGDAPSAPG